MPRVSSRNFGLGGKCISNQLCYLTVINANGESAGGEYAPLSCKTWKQIYTKIVSLANHNCTYVWNLCESFIFKGGNVWFMGHMDYLTSQSINFLL